MEQSPTRGQIALVLLLGLLWGLNWPAVKIALAEFGPWSLRAAALSIASFALLAFTLGRGGTMLLRRAQWWRLALPAVLAIAAPNILIAHAQLSAPTGRIAVVAFTMPVWATVLARLILGERLDQRRLLGLALGIAGLVALGWPLVVAGELSFGLLLAFLAAISWAAGTVLLKRFPSEATPLAFATWQLIIGAACAIAGMLIFEGPMVWSLSAPTLLAFAYHAVLGQALATVLWFEVVTRIPASIAALGTLLVPAVGVASAMLILGEQPSAADHIGLALIVAAASTVLLPSSGASELTRDTAPRVLKP
jgi:drug/metabolite transporter (DMT)-like permease